MVAIRAALAFALLFALVPVAARPAPGACKHKGKQGGWGQQQQANVEMGHHKSAGTALSEVTGHPMEGSGNPPHPMGTFSQVDKQQTKPAPQPTTGPAPKDAADPKPQPSSDAPKPPATAMAIEKSPNPAPSSSAAHSTAPNSPPMPKPTESPAPKPAENPAPKPTTAAAPNPPPKPAPAPAPAGGSKIGISWPIQEGTVQPVTKFFGDGSKVSWWFNWNKNYGPGLFPKDQAKPQIKGEFVPMFFDSSFVDNGIQLEPGWKAVQGYNEPDMHSAGVATPMSPTDAAGTWKSLVSKARAENPSAKIWSPAVSANHQWLKDFFGAICPGGLSGCDVAPDYLAVHVYATSLDSFKTQVESYHNDFGLDIAITEFACHAFDGSPAASTDQVSQFMKDTTQWLDSTPWIHKYAWFGSVIKDMNMYSVAPSNRLMDGNGELTPLGKQWVGGGR